jgi:hypothetical protein
MVLRVCVAHNCTQGKRRRPVNEKFASVEFRDGCALSEHSRHWLRLGGNPQVSFLIEVEFLVDSSS